MLKELFICIVYVSVTGFSAFIVGRLLPPSFFDETRFPFAVFSFEKDGAVYEKIGVRVWKTKLPDMGRFFPKLLPPKRLTSKEPAVLDSMIKETCVAEFIHVLLFFAGFYCLVLWDGRGGVIFTILYNTFGNLPFIIIQRYNRPRLVRFRIKQAAKLQAVMTAKGEEILRANAHTDL